MAMAQDTHFDRYGTQLTKSAVVTGPVATTAIVAAPGVGFKIRVLAWLLNPDGAAVMTWKSAATAKTGDMKGAVGVPSVAPFCPVGWFDCGENEALNLTNGTAAANGIVVYAIVKVGA